MELQTVNGNFVKSIGFFMRNGERVQRRWYLGKDESEAIVKAAELKTKWKQRTTDAKRRNESPVWTAAEVGIVADATAEMTLAALKAEGAYVPLDLETETVHHHIPTLIEKYLDGKRSRLTLRNRSAIRISTIQTVKANLSACLKPFPQFSMLSHFENANTLKTIHDFWMGSDHGERSGGKVKTVSERAAVNYLNELKAFIRWAESETTLDFNAPKELTQWKFSLKKGVVIVPEIAELKLLFGKASDRMKAWIYLALNGGQLAEDIGVMTTTDFITEKSATYLQKARVKKKGKDTEYKGSWILWPETTAAIAAVKATREDGRIFETKVGTPVHEFRENGRADSVGFEFHELVHGLIADGKAIRSDITFSTLRAFGASWIANETKNEYFAKLFLCHAVGSGATANYIHPDYALLKPHILAMRKALKAAAVF